MSKIIYLLILLLFISACVQESTLKNKAEPVKSEEQATHTQSSVSEQINNATKSLDDIDKLLDGL